MIPSIQTVVYIVVFVIVGGIIFGILDQLIQKAPFMPADWKPTARYILFALAGLVIIGLLLSFITGTPIFRQQGL